MRSQKGNCGLAKLSATISAQHELTATLSQKIDSQHLALQGTDGSVDGWHFCHRHDAAGAGIKTPDLPKSASTSQLLESIGHEAPAFFSFFVSFLYCGLLWVMHHLAMHFVRHLQIALVWLNLLFLMSISVMPFSCGLLGHFLRNPVAQEIYFGNMFVAAALLAAQWLVATKKKLISEDEPQKAQLMGQQIFFFPTALGAAMLAVLFINPQAGFYAMAIVLVALRLWQRIWHRNQVTNP
ncbi:MAG TPA: TMEM175 family protein [Candidatus Angelobacter sp.]|nr:TMEM175 family protein [Candidatus Angelobacter sp.]